MTWSERKLELKAFDPLKRMEIKETRFTKTFNSFNNVTLLAPVWQKNLETFDTTLDYFKLKKKQRKFLRSWLFVKYSHILNLLGTFKGSYRALV